MKQLLLSLTILGCILLSSCDSNNNPTDVVIPIPITNFVKAEINGVNVTFNQTNVVKQEITSNCVTYTDLIVSANKQNEIFPQIVFKLAYMETGPDTCYYFLYDVDEVEYDIETGNSFDINITQSTANNIKGTYSGTLSDFNGETATLTNGTFDISF